MLTVHHLNQSRSQRILWALEELALPYQIVRYQREKTMLAPPALKKVHPLGKSPVIEDHGMVIAESGAILEYLQDTYDSIGRFKPADAQGKQHYRFWLHYAEGSLMPLLLMRLLFTSLGKPPVPLGLRTLGGVIGKGAQKAYLNPQLETHARFIDGHLANHPLVCRRAVKYGGYPDELPAICAACPRRNRSSRPYQRMESAGRNASSLAASDSAGRSVYHSRRIMAFL